MLFCFSACGTAALARGCLTFADGTSRRCQGPRLTAARGSSSAFATQARALHERSSAAARARSGACGISARARGRLAFSKDRRARLFSLARDGNTSAPLLSTPIWILRLGGVGTAEVATPGKSAMRPVCGNGAVRGCGSAGSWSRGRAHPDHPSSRDRMNYGIMEIQGASDEYLLDHLHQDSARRFHEVSAEVLQLMGLRLEKSDDIWKLVRSSRFVA